MNIYRIKKEIRKHQIISFDIFDTLLLRPFAQPKDLFQYIEERYNLPGFKEERISAENKSRIKHQNQEEITYSQIYKEIDNKFKNIKKIELETEKELLTYNQKIKPIYDFAVSNNKRIIIVSDIYFSKVFLKKILNKNNYFNFEFIYSSADILKTKNSGSIYKHISNIYKNQKILHIGDNYESDFLKAKQNNIESIFIKKPIEDLLVESKINDFYQKNKNNLGVSTILGILQMFERNKYNYWQTVGLMYAGPIVKSYSQWITERAIKDKIDSLIFVARDGYSIKKVFDTLNNRLKIKTYYISAPRKVNSICNLDYSKNEEEIFYLKTILDYFNPEKSLNIQSIKEGEKILKKNYMSYKVLSDNKKTEYTKYIKTFKINGNRIGIVDTRTSFFSAQKLIQSSLKNKKFYGYYWDVLNKNPKTLKEYTYSSFSKTPQNIENWDIMELLMTSPEPPIKDISNKKIIYNKPTREEKRRIQTYKKIYTGIIEYTEKVKEIFNNNDVFTDSQTIIEWLKLFMSNLNKNDIKNLKKIKHSSDLSHTKYKPLINFKINMIEEKLNTENPEIKNHINLILGEKFQVIWLLSVNILLSKIIFGKDRLKLHQNVWYLKKRLNLINNKIEPIINITKDIKIISLLAKKWQKEVFNKKANKKIDVNHLDIAFIIPAPIKGSGGHRNFFRAIKFLKKSGHNLTVYYTETNQDAKTVRDNVSQWFYDMSGIPFIEYKGEMGYHDVAICTFWKTAYDIQKNINKIKYPFYFVQDFEPMFSQMGSDYILAENTYKFGFHHICSGPWCKDFLINKYHADAEYFQFPVDKKIYNTNKPRTKKNKNIIFFAKPEMPRRCCDLGLKALEYFHNLRPDVEIITFGSNNLSANQLPFKATCVGLLPTIEDLADLYRNADFGLVFSTTNPSLVPYEMMSCGCPVGDLDLDLALSKYGNSKDNVFLLDSIPEKMGQQLADIFDSPKEMEKKAKSGKNFVEKEFPTEEEMGKIVENIIKSKIKK